QVVQERRDRSVDLGGCGEVPSGLLVLAAGEVIHADDEIQSGGLRVRCEAATELLPRRGVLRLLALRQGQQTPQRVGVAVVVAEGLLHKQETKAEFGSTLHPRGGRPAV